jgi:hypothetical protein
MASVQVNLPFFFYKKIIFRLCFYQAIKSMHDRRIMIAQYHAVNQTVTCPICFAITSYILSNFQHIICVLFCDKIIVDKCDQAE